MKEIDYPCAYSLSAKHLNTSKCILYTIKNTQVNTMNTNQAYLVKTEGDEEGRTYRTLGIATGEEHLIREFYEDKKSYSPKFPVD